VQDITERKRAEDDALTGLALGDGTIPGQSRSLGPMRIPLHSSKAIWTFRNTSPAECTNSISILSMRSSNRERSGACQTRSLLHSRNWNPIPQFKATAKLGEFLESRFSHSF
jgi:hypothetical protein